MGIDKLFYFSGVPFVFLMAVRDELLISYYVLVKFRMEGLLRGERWDASEEQRHE